MNERRAMTEAAFYILLSLYEPLHGYGIILKIKELSDGKVILGTGTLYGALNNLQKKELISPIVSDNTDKKEYIITDKGKKMVNIELDRLKQLVNITNKIII